MVSLLATFAKRAENVENLPGGIVTRGNRAATARIVAVGLIAIVFTGCGDSQHPLANVSGMVTIDGRPFAQGKVMFAPVAAGASSDAGKPAFGKLQPDGTFVLQTGDDDGAVVGEHWATVISTADANDKSSAAAAPKFSRVAVPQRFTVEAGKDNRIEIKLSRQDLAKFGQK
jgi:hypothetical protein